MSFGLLHTKKTKSAIGADSAMNMEPNRSATVMVSSALSELWAFKRRALKATNARNKIGVQ